MDVGKNDSTVLKLKDITFYVLVSLPHGVVYLSVVYDSLIFWSYLLPSLQSIHLPTFVSMFFISVLKCLVMIVTMDHLFTVLVSLPLVLTLPIIKR